LSDTNFLQTLPKGKKEMLDQQKTEKLRKPRKIMATAMNTLLTFCGVGLGILWASVSSVSAAEESAEALSLWKRGLWGDESQFPWWVEIAFFIAASGFALFVASRLLPQDPTPRGRRNYSSVRNRGSARINSSSKLGRNDPASSDSPPPPPQWPDDSGYERQGDADGYSQ
jgi:hypothetical protein